MEKTEIKKTTIKSFIHKAIRPISKWLVAEWPIVSVIFLGAFLRLYKIAEYLTFLGDEGRDVIIVRRLLVDFDFFLIGPGTSIGGMYLGPYYYYFMAPFLFLWDLSPVGPAVGVALLGLATIYLIYKVTSEWFSKTAGLLAAFLYAISPVVITFSRASWNPNVMPFFALLTVYSIWKVWRGESIKWMYVSVVSLVFTLNSHYMGLVLVPVVGVIWLLRLISLEAFGNWKKETADYVRSSLISLGLFLLLMSPLLIFDIRHGWINSSAMYKFFTERQTTVSIKPWNAIPQIPSIAENLFTRLLGAKNEILGKIILAFVSIPSLLILLGRKHLHKNEPSAFFILFLWIGMGLVSFGLYKQHIYDHYFGFLFPAVFILFAGFWADIFENLSKVGKGIWISFLLVVVAFNLMENPFRYHPNRQLQRAEAVAEKIIELSDGREFNFAVIAERNYEDGYKYFLDLNRVKSYHADKWDENTIKDVLFVICEEVEEKCNPTNSPKAEVANFGMSKVVDKWVVDGVIIYKLIHNKQ